jgi:tRNA1Val (adenine37-N6)-methyltransferase
MANPYFQFKQFTVYHDRCAMKVTTDACFFGAWCAGEISACPSYVDHLLDIGTGSGLLSLMIAQKSRAMIDAVEIDVPAAEQAAENFSASPWSDRLQVFQKNVLRFETGKTYDCIVSNPPFYENELASGEQRKNIAHHSREMNIPQVLDIIKSKLRPEGIFFMLLPFKRMEEIEVQFKARELFAVKTEWLRQSLQHQPFRAMIMGSHKRPEKSSLSSTAVWNEEKQYTERFAALLRDYYLYL